MIFLFMNHIKIVIAFYIMQRDSEDILKSIYDTDQIPIEERPIQEEGPIQIPYTQSIEIKENCQQNEYFHESVQLKPEKQVNKGANKKEQKPEDQVAVECATIEKIAQMENEPQATESMLQNYDKMMYEWRKIQRDSLSKESYHKFNQKPKEGDKQQIFHKYLDEIHSYLRAKFVYEELIEPLHIQKILKTSNITDLQYIYLLTFRAWCDINRAKQNFKGSQKQKNIDNKTTVYLVEPIIKMGERIQAIFQIYHKALAFKEKSFMNRLKNIKNFLFHYKAKSARDKILYGFEGVDFTRKQQVEFTEKYVDQIVDRVKESKKRKSIQKLVPRVMNYGEIVSFEMVKMSGFDDFDRTKNAILQEWFARSGDILEDK